MTAPDSARQKKNDQIEALRFFAALSVVFVHIPLVGIGRFGVDIFFVISGLVMMLSTQRGGDKFMLKRAIRILPTYYLFTIGIFAVAFVFPALLNSTTPDFDHLLKSMLFIPFDKNGIGHYPVLFLGWTLNYEMFFYLLFAVGMRINHELRGELTAGLLVIVMLACRNTDALPFSAYANSIAVEFVLGILLFELTTKRRPETMVFLVAVYCVPLLVNGGDLSLRGYLYGVPSFALCLFALTIAAKVTVPRFIVYLGGTSYALYLTHPYIIRVIEKIVGRVGDGLAVDIGVTIMSLVAAILASIVVYRFIEVPTRGFLRRTLIDR